MQGACAGNLLLQGIKGTFGSSHIFSAARSLPSQASCFCSPTGAKQSLPSQAPRHTSKATKTHKAHLGISLGKII
jgi:hypothetical protein